MPDPAPPAPRGRAAATNPASRFERLEVELEEAPPDRVPTEFLRDTSRSILVRNDSPDVPFTWSVNPYRGCEHGCIYCYARPTHEYLGFSAGLDFESRILVKEEAAALLERELAAPSWRARQIGISGVTDPYQPVERRLALTRGCLEVLARYRNPTAIVTKNSLVERDTDLLAGMADARTAAVFVSITTLDAELARRMEPRTSHPQRRLETIRRLSGAGVPCGLLMAPIVPGLTDHEIPGVLEAAREAGARWARYLVLRLPGAVAGLFDAWLAEHYPNRRGRVLGRIRDLRGGRLNDPRFGSRMRGEGIYADQIAALFETSRRRHGYQEDGPELRSDGFRRPGGEQIGLFSG